MFFILACVYFKCCNIVVVFAIQECELYIYSIVCQHSRNISIESCVNVTRVKEKEDREGEGKLTHSHISTTPSWKCTCKYVHTVH